MPFSGCRLAIVATALASQQSTNRANANPVIQPGHPVKPMKKWHIKDPSSGNPSHSLPSHLPPAAVWVLVARGIETEQQLNLFLRPPHRLPYCPMRLGGMERAVQLILKLADKSVTGSKGPRIGIVGDFDVDGITGTALLVEGLERLGLQTIPYLPDRISEGHGLSSAAINYTADLGASLIITVDCGVSSVQEVEQANQMGIKVIVTDHHVPPTSPPAAAAIINPRIPGNEYPFPDLCGAGLAFKLIQGLFKVRGEPIPQELVELAALGTIADLVTLHDENRHLVKQGLRQLSRTERPGLQAMYRLAGLGDKPITSETVAFNLAPRLNAAGRMGHASDSLKLLTTRDHRESEELAKKLESQNHDRRILTRKVILDVHSQLANLDTIPSFIVAQHPGVTPGIAGLVAGNLAEKFQRPAVALARVTDKTFVGSGRGIPVFNLVRAFNSCAHLFVRHGGHAQAAGFTIRQENIHLLQSSLTTIAMDELSGKDLYPPLAIDCELGLSEISPLLLETFDKMEPFGTGNPKPLFLTRGLEAVETSRVGKEGQHLKLMVSDGKRRMKALMFNRGEDWEAFSDRIDLVYAISCDYWRGKRQINLVIEDFRKAGS